jgi:hypothetical protein
MTFPCVYLRFAAGFLGTTFLNARSNASASPAPAFFAASAKRADCELSDVAVFRFAITHFFNESPET